MFEYCVTLAVFLVPRAQAGQSTMQSFWNSLSAVEVWFFHFVSFDWLSHVESYLFKVVLLGELSSLLFQANCLKSLLDAASVFLGCIPFSLRSHLHLTDLTEQNCANF